MKKIFTFLLASCCATYLFADSDLVKTKIEQAINTRGSLIKQEILSVDNLSVFRIDVIKVTNLENFSMVSGVKIACKIPVGKEVKSISNYIDQEEIDGIITSLEYMNTMIKSKMLPTNYTEIKYATISGVELNFFTILNDKNKLDWSFSVQPDIRTERSFTELQKEDIEKLKKVFTLAKAKL